MRVPDDQLLGLRRARDRIDREYASPLDLDDLATVASMSKYHFLRSFRTAFGHTPGAYLTERRIERAQDLLRTTNLTVTEVCWLVGYSALGSFSARFRTLVGVSPSEYQARWADGAPRIPGCWVMMHGLSDRVRCEPEPSPTTPPRPAEPRPPAARPPDDAPRSAASSAIPEKSPALRRPAP